MRKEERLTRSSQFAAVLNQDKYWADDFTVIKAKQNGLEHSRFGFITSKKIGNAVVRNRIRRLLRESIRVSSVAPGWDVVIIARKGAVGKNLGEIQPSIAKLLSRANLLEKGI